MHKDLYKQLIEDGFTMLPVVGESNNHVKFSQSEEIGTPYKYDKAKFKADGVYWADDMDQALQDDEMARIGEYEDWCEENGTPKGGYPFAAGWDRDIDYDLVGYIERIDDPKQQIRVYQVEAQSWCGTHRVIIDNAYWICEVIIDGDYIDDMQSEEDYAYGGWEGTPQHQYVVAPLLKYNRQRRSAGTDRGMDIFKI